MSVAHFTRWMPVTGNTTTTEARMSEHVCPECGSEYMSLLSVEESGEMDSI